MRYTSTGSSTSSAVARSARRGEPLQMYGSGCVNELPSMNVISSLGSSGSATGVRAASALGTRTSPKPDCGS